MKTLSLTFFLLSLFALSSCILRKLKKDPQDTTTVATVCGPVVVGNTSTTCNDTNFATTKCCTTNQNTCSLCCTSTETLANGVCSGSKKRSKQTLNPTCGPNAIAGCDGSIPFTVQWYQKCCVADKVNIGLCAKCCSGTAPTSVGC